MSLGSDTDALEPIAWWRVIGSGMGAAVAVTKLHYRLSGGRNTVCGRKIPLSALPELQERAGSGGVGRRFWPAREKEAVEECRACARTIDRERGH